MSAVSYLKSFFSNLQEDAGLITKTIHKEPFIQDIHNSEVFESTSLFVASFLCIAVTHWIMTKIVKANRDRLQLKNSKQIQKAAYQITNLLVNCALGTYGFKTIYNAPNPLALIFPWHEPDVVKRITGYTQFNEFFAYQLGYNLWALPVGIFKVNETPEMILHHSAVLTSTVLACYTNIGYRIYSVYIFGMAELSSVPLALMNLLRDRREWTTKNLPLSFAFVRIWFAVSFLALRVIIPTPMIVDLWRSSGLVLSTMTFWKQTEFIDGTESFDDFKMGVCVLDVVMRICLGFLQVRFCVLAFFFCDLHLRLFYSYCDFSFIQLQTIAVLLGKSCIVWNFKDIFRSQEIHRY